MWQTTISFNKHTAMSDTEGISWWKVENII